MGENSAASGGMWAFLTILIVLIVVAAIYFGGFFNQKKQIDINVKTPGLILFLNR